MRVRYIGGSLLALVGGTAYDVAAVEGDWYRILDETTHFSIRHARSR